MMQFKFTKVRDVQSPTRGTHHSSGFDFYIPSDIKAEDIKITPLNEPLKLDVSKYITDEDIIVPGWRGVLIPSWLKVYMTKWSDDYTYDLVLIWKSWVSVKTNLLVWAAVIDNDYRWEFNFHLINPHYSYISYLNILMQCQTFIHLQIYMLSIFELLK